MVKELNHLKVSSVERVAVLGGGSWATALVKVLSEKELKIKWWLRREEDVQFVLENAHNPKYLSDVSINLKKVKPTASLDKALDQVDAVFIVIPAAFIESALREYNPKFNKTPIIASGVKGLVPSCHLPVTDWLAQKWNINMEAFSILAGPCHAEEVAMERLSYLTIAGLSQQTTDTISNLLEGPFMKATPYGDLYGVEYNAIMKNIIAVMAGVCHGLGYGDNFQAVLITNAIQEIGRFLNAKFPENRNLLASCYLGDLLVTAYSQFSRNRTLGTMVGRGYSVKAAQLEMNMIAEGYYAIKSIYEVKKGLEIDMPILEAAYQIFYQNQKAGPVVKSLSSKFV